MTIVSDNLDPELLKFLDDVYGPGCECPECGEARYDCAWPTCECFPELYPLVEVVVIVTPHYEEDLQRDLEAAVEEQKELAEIWSAVDGDGL